jgi:cell division protein FtsQ
MYGSTVNEVDRSRSFGNRPHRSRAKVQAKIHPGEAGVVSGRRVRIDVPAIGRLFTLRGILLMLVSILTVGAAVILMFFNFEKARIYGNTKYSQQQIESFITRGTLGDNTFVMALKYHHRKVADIPFVDRIDIDIVSPSTVRVNITEKPTDGCIFYNGNNVYFSKEGIIQTVSGRKVEDTTIVNGIVLTHSNTGTQIMAKNQLGLDLSLELMRAADKYGVQVDTIDVDARNNLTFSIGDVKVRIGKTGYDNKMFRLHRIYPYLEGRSGVISMSGYKDTYDSNYNIVLSPEGSEAAVRAAAEIEEAEAEAEEAAEKSGEEPAAAEADGEETAAPGTVDVEAGALEAGEQETAVPETVSPEAETGGQENSGPETAAPQGGGAEPVGQEAEEAAQVIGSASQGSQTTASAAPESIPVPRKSP